MTINDVGPHPHIFDIEAATRENEDYRCVAWTGKFLQDTLMSIPAGTWHDVITGDEPLRLYAIYAPSHHAAGVVQATSADAERDESSGRDVPPDCAAPGR